MTTPYASAAELEAFVSPAVWESIDVDDVDRLLARATEAVDDHCRGAFVVDAATDLPRDSDIADALRDATCAVIEAWAEVGEENDVDGLAGSDISVAGYTGKRAPTLPPRARRFLAAQGLLQPAQHAVGVWP